MAREPTGAKARAKRQTPRGPAKQLPNSPAREQPKLRSGGHSVVSLWRALGTYQQANDAAPKRRAEENQGRAEKRAEKIVVRAEVYAI